MKLIIFSHPVFLRSQSMPRYVNSLAQVMKANGHTVEIWTPRAMFYNLSASENVKKWLGYIDQFIVFPFQVKRKISNLSGKALFVFTDHAQGPWVPLLAGKPHVIHCHDFLAQQSALNGIRENTLSLTGRLYQAYIRWGYSKGKNFVSVSEKTRTDLHGLLTYKPPISEVVYNTVSSLFVPEDQVRARAKFSKRFNIDLSRGYILHVGGNQWYKNRKGVIEIYDCWRQEYTSSLPLLLIGQQPTTRLKELADLSNFKHEIYFLPNVDDQYVVSAYAGASLFLFPSLAEGFGWPIVEAMATGCPVITTDEAPMTEVAGVAATLIPRRPFLDEEVTAWRLRAAATVNELLTISDQKRREICSAGIINADRFNSVDGMKKLEIIYKQIYESTD